MEGTLELAGLADRREFYAAVDAAALGGRAWTVLLVDLDRFARVNYVHGHAAGDAVLATVVARLVRCVHPGDAVCRLGGDEFGVLVSWAGKPDVCSLVLDVINAVEQPIPIRDVVVEVGCTVGVGHASGDEHPIEVLTTAEADRDQRKAHRRHERVTTAH